MRHIDTEANLNIFRESVQPECRTGDDCLHTFPGPAAMSAPRGHPSPLPARSITNAPCVLLPLPLSLLPSKISRELEADKLLTVFLITVCCSSLQPLVLIMLMMTGRQCEMYSAAATPCVNSSPFLPIFCEIGLPLLLRFFVRNFSVTCHRCVADEICLSCSSVTR